MIIHKKDPEKYILERGVKTTIHIIINIMKQQKFQNVKNTYIIL